MFLTIFLVTIVAAIIAFFAQEFHALAKRFFEVPGFLLLLPLFFASWLVFLFQYWVLLFLRGLGYEIQLVVAYYEQFLSPRPWNGPLVLAVLLTLLSLIPTFSSVLLKKRQVIFGSKRILFRMSLGIWFILSIVILVNRLG